jgi:hypothetical protein
VALARPDQREGFRLARCLDLVRAGRPLEAAEEADQLAAAPGADGGTFYNAACVTALASRAAPPASGAPSRRLAGAAVALLERARRAGFFRNDTDLDLLRNDPDLDPLRGRDDFRIFVLDAAFPDDPFRR